MVALFYHKNFYLSLTCIVTYRVFDPANVYDQYAACSATVAEYRDALLYGQVDVDSAMEKFNEELKENGIDEIIEEMQKQYDEFLGK